jgi:hypothetical protein
MNRVLARVEIDRERLHAVGQRAGVDLVGAGVADKRDMDIGVAFDSGGQFDFLGRARGRGVEPVPGIHPVPLDGDEPGAGVGRLDLHLDLIARGIVVAGEGDLELRVFFQRSCEIRVAGDVILHARESLAGAVGEHIGEVARCSLASGSVEAGLRQRGSCSSSTTSLRRDSYW